MADDTDGEYDEDAAVQRRRDRAQRRYDEYDRRRRNNPYRQ